MSTTSNVMATAAFIAAHNAAQAAREAREELTRMQCRMSYDSKLCDSVCVDEHHEWLKNVSTWSARYNVTFTNQCGGPVQTPYEMSGLRGDTTMMVALAVFIVFASVVAWLFSRDSF